MVYIQEGKSKKRLECFIGKRLDINCWMYSRYLLHIDHLKNPQKIIESMCLQENCRSLYLGKRFR